MATPCTPKLPGFCERAVKNLSTPYEVDHIGKDPSNNKEFVNICSVVQVEPCSVKFDEGIDYFYFVRTLDNSGKQDITNLVKIPLGITIKLNRKIRKRVTRPFSAWERFHFRTQV